MTKQWHMFSLTHTHTHAHRQAFTPVVKREEEEGKEHGGKNYAQQKIVTYRSDVKSKIVISGKISPFISRSML